MACKIAAAGARNTMQGWVLEKAGDLSALAVKTVEIPTPGPQQIRTKVIAACTNPIDYKHAGLEGLSVFPAVFGCDGVGIVDAAGAEVTNVAVGDRVHYFGNVFAGHGTYAQFAIADAFAVAKVPEGMSDDVAAVTPCAAWTAYEALFDRMRLSKGQSVFIAAGAGGVGHFAIQMAKHVGARVITSASGENVQRLRDAGYEVVDYRNEDVKETVLKMTGGVGVDCAFDMLGEEQSLATQQVVRFAGQYAHIALGVPVLPNNGQFYNALTVHHIFTPGNVVRPAEAARFVAIAGKVNELLMSGAVKADISKTFGFDGVKEALDLQASGRTRGKLLIKME